MAIVWSTQVFPCAGCISRETEQQSSKCSVSLLTSRRASPYEHLRTRFACMATAWSVQCVARLRLRLRNAGLGLPFTMRHVRTQGVACVSVSKVCGAVCRRNAHGVGVGRVCVAPLVGRPAPARVVQKARHLGWAWVPFAPLRACMCPVLNTVVVLLCVLAR